VDAEAIKLIQASKEAFERAVAVIKPGVPLSKIGEVIRI